MAHARKDLEIVLTATLPGSYALIILTLGHLVFE